MGKTINDAQIIDDIAGLVILMSSPEPTIVPIKRSLPLPIKLLATPSPFFLQSTRLDKHTLKIHPADDSMSDPVIPVLPC